MIPLQATAEIHNMAAVNKAKALYEDKIESVSNFFQSGISYRYAQWSAMHMKCINKQIHEQWFWIEFHTETKSLHTQEPYYETLCQKSSTDFGCSN